MKETLFKKKNSELHSEADFTKKDGDVSSFCENNQSELLSEKAAALSALFSSFGQNLLTAKALSFITRDDAVAVVIKNKDGQPLDITEINLICRQATEMDFSTRITADGVEILTDLPRLADTKLYAGILALLSNPDGE